MTFKDRLSRAAPHLNLFVFVLAALFFNSPSAPTGSVAGGARAQFTAFSKPARNGAADVLRAVHVPDVLDLPVAQQPEGDPNYVSSRDGEATQFSTASAYGSIGLLAHNNLSGRSFSKLAVGQEVHLVYDDGSEESFVVTEVLQFQALSPTSPLSEFRDLHNDEVLSAAEMFERVYSGERHVTFQTCIAAYGRLSWGRLFVLAEPVRR